VLQLQAQLQAIIDEAQGEELRDNGGGEHGGAQWIARVVQGHDPRLAAADAASLPTASTAGPSDEGLLARSAVDVNQ
tara:strand:+ start:633 stop:863 length:231 start_codon:yes stop_codon:yes gene_type:complete